MLPLDVVVDRLAAVYGEPAAPPRRTLFELVLWENVAYLADDSARLAAFEVLQRETGLRPERILAATGESLGRVASYGILPAQQSEKLRRSARLVLDEFGGDLESMRDQPLARAKRALMRFPAIGEPGAEKILLFARSHRVLGLDSNGVRVLTRVGLVREANNYSATYRATQKLVAPWAERGFEWLIRAHLLLRQHGQELCRRTTPRCDRCPLASAQASNTMRVSPPWPCTASTVSIDS